MYEEKKKGGDLLIVTNNGRQHIGEIDEFYAGTPLLRFSKLSPDGVIDLPPGKIYYVKKKVFKAIPHIGGCLHFLKGTGYLYCPELLTKKEEVILAETWADKEIRFFR